MEEPVGTLTGSDRVALIANALESLTVDDLTFRMFTPPEIGKAMAFPGTYIVKGTKRETVRQYGNAVTPPVMKMLMDRCIATLS
jgi:DNA (cytosine-5)-methyltransferase 1